MVTDVPAELVLDRVRGTLDTVPSGDTPGEPGRAKSVMTGGEGKPPSLKYGVERNPPLNWRISPGAKLVPATETGISNWTRRSLFAITSAPAIRAPAGTP